ncbi:sugar phosphate isomerase/epimerase [Burkholderia sp. Bp9140]|uniref:sugar phosphate isomerase/epimerase family protein n=1 Tax=Burkholderia sp. Bp9140 TaxID=2184572 RepID=UPI000F5706C5|nr:sugar phosphate isomerase/epimerase family protein [Burkholderia sp. Bp9140]RQR51616.1 sugar phosphate isomerase/epimerase [Burkholderia sp. Bp9140]
MTAQHQANALILHTTVARFSNLVTDLDTMTALGFDGIELGANKLEAYLAAGYSTRDLNALLKDVYVPGMGFLIDIERQGEQASAMFKRAEELFELATFAGARGVQVLTGPVDVQAVIEWTQYGKTDRYTGVLGLPHRDQINVTAKNLAQLADMAAERGLVLYLETLSWAPVSGIDKSIQLIDAAGRANVKIVIDYWHCYTSGVTPDEIAKLDARLIYGVHVCDSLTFSGGIPNEIVLRDVPTGEGVLDLQQWTDAVKATGYLGWWSCELFCKKQQQQNAAHVAAQLRNTMARLVM